MKIAGAGLGVIPLLISFLLLCAAPRMGALHDPDSPVAGISLQDSMDMVLEMEAKPDFVKSKQYEELGQFLPASEVLLQVCFIINLA
jgi:hypothetical protein